MRRNVVCGLAATQCTSSPKNAFMPLPWTAGVLSSVGMLFNLGSGNAVLIAQKPVIRVGGSFVGGVWGPVHVVCTSDGVNRKLQTGRARSRVAWRGRCTTQFWVVPMALLAGAVIARPMFTPLPEGCEKVSF
eukprot:5797665-Prymnesium_polylepis.1